MSWYCVRIGALQARGMRRRIAELLSLVLLPGGYPVEDLAIFSRDETTWYLPPGAKEALWPVLRRSAEVERCDPPDPAALTVLLHYAPTGVDPWERHWGKCSPART